MGSHQDNRNYCYAESKPCTDWVQNYFKDCLCSLKDDVSFGFGLVSVSLWGFSEVPQIITNFKAKSSRGVSILLVMTWILGDVFNLAGCVLEPSTLPTQFYTALFYTLGSAILTCQCIYYDHITPWLRKKRTKEGQFVSKEDDGLLRKGLLVRKCGSSGDENVPRVPPFQTFVAAVSAASLPGHAAALNRTLLRSNLGLEEDRIDPVGQLMGWCMAVIYISGRIPQICLNMKRGNVDGLSPCMFVLALIANITYVLSILVRSCKWVDIKPNMPWLLDSIFCISLDLFILLQFVYYRYKRRKQYAMLAEAPHTLLT